MAVCFICGLLRCCLNNGFSQQFAFHDICHFSEILQYFAFLLSHPGMGVKYCNEFVCLSVCMYICFCPLTYLKNHVSKRQTVQYVMYFRSNIVDEVNSYFHISSADI